VTLAQEVLSKNGDLIMYFFIEKSRIWSLVWFVPQYECSVYGVCKAYKVCKDESNIQSCNCLQGFHPSDDRAWNSQEWSSSGFVWRNPLHYSATNGSTTDRFLQLRDKSMSDEGSIEYSHEYSSLQGCKRACLRNCSFIAFSITTNSNPPISCRLWFGVLLNM
ncbi:hypothetical protein KI387_021870, partial [Taxus chinensis]